MAMAPGLPSTASAKDPKAPGTNDGGTLADVDLPPQQTQVSKLSSSEDDTTNDVDVDIKIATLVAATFMPMPGVTNAPKPWEVAAGLLGK